MSNLEQHYSVLGLSANCSKDEIRQAYKQKALQYHPDKNPGDPEAEANFKRVGHAYSELTDPQPKQEAGGGGGYYYDDDDDDYEDDDDYYYYSQGGGGRSSRGYTSNARSYGGARSRSARGNGMEDLMEMLARMMYEDREGDYEYRETVDYTRPPPTFEERLAQSYNDRLNQRARDARQEEHRQQRARENQEEKDRNKAFKAERSAQAQEDARQEQLERMRAKSDAAQKAALEKVKLLALLVEELPGEEETKRERQETQEEEGWAAKLQRFVQDSIIIEKNAEMALQRKREKAVKAAKATRIAEEKQAVRQKAAEAKAAAAIALLDDMLQDLPTEESSQRNKMQNQEEKSRATSKKNFEEILGGQKEKELAAHQAERQRAKDLEAAARFADAQAAQQIEYAAKMKARQEREEADRATAAAVARKEAEQKAVELARQQKIAQEQAQMTGKGANHSSGESCLPSKAGNETKKKVNKSMVENEVVPKCATLNCKNRSSIQDSGDHQWYCEPCFSKWENDQQQQEGEACANCGVFQAEPSQCSVCKQVVYCSRGCQKADWPNHKAACKPTVKTSNAERPCKEYAKKGTCKLGSKCRLAH